MKKLIALTLITAILLSCVFIFSSCNKQLLDTTYNFDYAYVVWPDGTAEKLAIKSWLDFPDGEQIQIKTTEGHVYLFHVSNCVLADE